MAMMNEKIYSEHIEIERMTFTDLDEVLAIESDSFTSPWSKQGFRQEIINRKRSLPLVVRIDGHVAGYGVAWFVVDEIYIGNIAVHRSHRRKGIGELLLKKLLERGLVNDCRLATLEVRKTNRTAIELYNKFGFSAVAIRKGYYRDTGEDAVVMVKNLTQETETPSGNQMVHNL